MGRKKCIGLKLDLVHSKNTEEKNITRGYIIASTTLPCRRYASLDYWLLYTPCLYFVLKLTNGQNRLIHSSFQKFVYLNLVAILIYTSDLKIFNVLSVAPLIIIEGFDQSAHRILPSCPVMSYNGALGLKRKIISHWINTQ
jgi:hypothetical protein